jgi:hypothetical protein
MKYIAFDGCANCPLRDLTGNNRNSGWACFAIAAAPRFLPEDLKTPNWCPLPDFPRSETPQEAT